MTLLGERHCMRECCESYYFMFRNIIFIFVFCVFAPPAVRRWCGGGDAGGGWHVHTKTENEGFMALSVKLFSVLLFVTLLLVSTPSSSFVKYSSRRRSSRSGNGEWNPLWMDSVACARLQVRQCTANEWIFTIMSGLAPPFVSLRLRALKCRRCLGTIEFLHPFSPRPPLTRLSKRRFLLRRLTRNRTRLNMPFDKHITTEFLSVLLHVAIFHYCFWIRLVFAFPLYANTELEWAKWCDSITLCSKVIDVY